VHLATLLWGETTDYRSRRNLTHVLGQLHDRLPGCLIADQQRVGWSVDAPFAVDVQACTRLLRAAHASLARDAATQTDQLAQAVALYRGDLLADLALSDSPEFDAWLMRTREHWQQQIAAALATLSTHYAAHGSTTLAEGAMRRWVALEPWQEAAHRALIELLAREGRRAEALIQYEQCRHTLVRDLGIEPAPETTALYHALLRGNRALLAREHGDLVTHEPPMQIAASSAAGWGSIPAETGGFYGREHELAQLHDRIDTPQSRVIAILGMGGIGKTALVAQYVRRFTGSGTVVIWRSLLNAPSLDELLDSCLSVLPEGQRAPLGGSAARIDLLLAAMQRQRCLLILDNVESLLQAGERAGLYRAGYAAYGQLLLRIAQSAHRSCVLLTSRELPSELAALAVASPHMHALELGGLDRRDGGALLAAHGLSQHSALLPQLVAQYSGNPLALRLIANVINEIYAGAIDRVIGQPAPIFEDIRQVLDQQIARLTGLERAIVLRLAIEREPLTEAALWEMFARVWAKGRFVEALRSLIRRSLVERYDGAFGLQNVVIEYLTTLLIEQVAQEFSAETPVLLHTHPLLTTRSKEYVRQSQRRVIMQPLLDWLTDTLGQTQILAICQRLLAAMRHDHPLRPSYLAGTLLNMLLQLQVDLRDYDLSQLSVWQADLRGADLPGVDLRAADLRDTVFTDYAGAVIALACRSDGALLAVGTDARTIHLVRTDDQRLSGVCQGHASHVGALAFSPDGMRLLSGSDDLTLRVWDVAMRRTIHQLRGHIGGVTSVAWHPDGMIVASGSTDRTARIWDAASGMLLHILRGHTGTIPAVAFSPDGALLATGSYDHDIRIWDWRAGRLLHTLTGHTDPVSTLVFFHAPHVWGGQARTIVISGSHDRTLRYWDAHSGEQLHALQSSHTAPIMALALRSDDVLLSSGSDDRTICVWATRADADAPVEPQLIRTLVGHVGTVLALAMQPAGNGQPGYLFSGSPDKMLRVWDTQSGHTLALLRGHSKWLQVIAVAHDGRLLVAGNDGSRIRIWDGATGRTLHTLRDVTAIEKLTFSADGRWLVSPGWDATVRVWDTLTGGCTLTLGDHTAPTLVAAIAPGPAGRDLVVSTGLDRSISVWDAQSGALLNQLHGHHDRPVGLAFHPNHTLLASGAWDGTIGLWDLACGTCLSVLTGPTAPIESVAFDPSGTLLAGGSWDRKVYVWDVATGALLHTLEGHVGGLEMVAFSPDGTLLASCGCEPSVCVWDVRQGRLQYHLQGHTSWVRCVAFSTDGSLLASGSDDGTLRLWDLTRDGAGTCQQTIAMEDPYSGLKIGGATGLTDIQRMALKTLGAVEA
jgi:WD40 repeat protein/DNA-binding SARP family transcriptional activator